MKKTELSPISIHGVATTSLITLYCHALESQSKNPILKDPKAVEITQFMNSELIKSKNKMHRKLAKGQLNRKMVVHIAVRARRYDQYATDFLSQAPDGIIVNIGCGFDTRFHRIDNDKVHFYDLDLPELIEMKKEHLPENDRYRYIASSVLDMEWMKVLSQYKNRPILFMAEGVLMYLHFKEVHDLVLKLQSEFPGSELVCEVFNAMWLTRPWKKMINFKMQHQLHMGQDAAFHFGIRNSREMESWHPGIQFIDDWTYFDDPEPKIGWIKIFKHIQIFRRTQWTVHYRLN